MATESAVGSDDKESPMDFVLWKAAKPGEPSWESPWGLGRPGWHIECSAMSLKYLGNTLDIHGGGQDLVFPHHENEIAQSETFTGITPFVKYWLHNGLMQLGGDKMSKSLGNLITIKEALERYSADAIRIFVLSSHYRSPVTYSEEGLEAAERGADRLRQAAHGDGKGEKVGEEVDVEPYRQRFIEAMDDDFNTARALAILFDLAREINRADEAGYEPEEARKRLLEMADVLGLALKPTRKLVRPVGIPSAEEFGTPTVTVTPVGSEEDIENLIRQRNRLREAKLWQLADDIRAQLGELGIVLEDTPQGTVWKRKR